MERLSGLDASMLYSETPTLHMHTLKIGVLDVSTVPGGYSYDLVKAELAARLHLLPAFRHKVRWVPGQLHHPVWIDDPDFDLDHHVMRRECPAPGTSRELDAVISEICGTQLDPSRPLWEIHVVEGLADGHVAFVSKIHHAVADGVAAAGMLAHVTTTDPEESAAGMPPQPWEPEPEPTAGRLVRDALVDAVALARRLPALLLQTFRGIVEVVKTRRGLDRSPPAPFAGPRTMFNRALTPNRVFSTATMPLADFKLVKSAFDCTINDVVLGMTGGALRRYLMERDEPVDPSLICSVPVASDPPGTVRRSGNRVSNLFTSVHTDIDDPVERLAAIHEVTKGAKDIQNALGLETMQNWVDYSPPAPFRFLWRWFMPRSPRPPVNLVVSNVPGPREPLYIAGARMAGLFSVGPIMENIGLNVTVWSYCDSMNLSVLSCPELAGDLPALVDAIREEMTGLVKLAEERRAG